MVSIVSRFGRLLVWIALVVMVSSAVAVTMLRVTLPRLNHYQTDIEAWLTQATGVSFDIGEVKGYWKNTRPSIVLNRLEVEDIREQAVRFDAEQVTIELDLLATIAALTPKFASIDVNGLNIDISQLDLLSQSLARGGDVQADTPQKTSSNAFQVGPENPVIAQLDRLFLRELQDFNLHASSITYQTFRQEIRTLNIEQLQWQNRQQNHQMVGTVSIQGHAINSFDVRADFTDHGTILDVSGALYAQAHQVDINPWLTPYLKDDIGIQSGQISFNSWLSFEHSKPSEAYIELLPSEIAWQALTEESNASGGEPGLLLLETGILKLVPLEQSKDWQISAHDLRVRTNDIQWPSLDVAFQQRASHWLLNMSQLDIDALKPLSALLPNRDEIAPWLDKLQPSGQIENIRLAYRLDDGTTTYSASLRHAGMAQWELLPEVHDLRADIAGKDLSLRVKATLVDDVLPYGDVFQAPLNIDEGRVDIVWQADDSGWRLWSDHVSVSTPDLQAVGAFRLDVPKQASPFLSIYAEADAHKASETWRYLPVRALGTELTDYLSTAVQGGKAEAAQILWYGPLNSFPYPQHDGIFQAKVGLESAQFSFDTRWPAVTELQLDLLFENESMYLDSHSAKLMDVTAKRIRGQIASLTPDGAIEISAQASAQGPSVRDYMLATPLVDSVGAALNTVQVSGLVQADFQLNIPFDQSVHSRAWGYADLANNQISIQTPSIELQHAKGRIQFDNDVVSSSGLFAQLLDQPISIDFKGEDLNRAYGVGIDIVADWDITPLRPFIGDKWLARLQGHSPWSMDVDLQLNDVGFTYQVEAEANLDFVSSQYPEPFTKALGEKRKVELQASGNQERISGRVQLPGAKYQAEIDITGKTPVLTATNLLVGQGGFKASPIVGHHASIRGKSFNLDDWIAFIGEQQTVTTKSRLSDIDTPEIPMPERLSLNVDVLTLAGLEWNSVNLSGKKKGLSWLMNLDSAEAKGQASYLEPYDLSVAFERLHVFTPALEIEGDGDETPIFRAEEDEPLISDFDRQFHHLMPNLTLNIKDFWLQGYKVGTVNIDLQRQGDRLNWHNMSFNSGTSQVIVKGWWELVGEKSHSAFNVFVQGEDNTELMERFGINSGIQKAPFESTSDLAWQGAPWSIQVETLQGNVEAKFGKGIISDVSGAARLLGMFSLDSIIRRMQLDFSDVFDKGMAFDSITGTGEIKQGIFVTNDLEMDAIAGDMLLRGSADMSNRTVDAEVTFTPDLTSGLPVLTAFAVAPQTAWVVFAISTVISPVVEVFTKIRYQVKGPFDAPEVKELSRSQGDYTLPSDD